MKLNTKSAEYRRKLRMKQTKGKGGIAHKGAGLPFNGAVGAGLVITDRLLESTEEFNA